MRFFDRGSDHSRYRLRSLATRTIVLGDPRGRPELAWTSAWVRFTSRHPADRRDSSRISASACVSVRRLRGHSTATLSFLTWASRAGLIRRAHRVCTQASRALISAAAAPPGEVLLSADYPRNDGDSHAAAKWPDAAALFSIDSFRIQVHKFMYSEQLR